MRSYLEGIHPLMLLQEAERIGHEEPHSVLKFVKLAVLNLASMSLEGQIVSEKNVLEELSGLTDKNEARMPLANATGTEEEIEVHRKRFQTVRESQVKEIVDQFVAKGILRRTVEQ